MIVYPLMAGMTHRHELLDYYEPNAFPASHMVDLRRWEVGARFTRPMQNQIDRRYDAISVCFRLA
jgi:hypothetical protein